MLGTGLYKASLLINMDKWSLWRLDKTEIQCLDLKNSGKGKMLYLSSNRSVSAAKEISWEGAGTVSNSPACDKSVTEAHNNDELPCLA